MMRWSYWILAAALVIGVEPAPGDAPATPADAPANAADAGRPGEPREPASPEQPGDAENRRRAQPPHLMNREGGLMQEEAIARALFSRTSLAANDVSLIEVLERIEREHEIQIRIDDSALDEAGISPTDPVACNVKNLRLSSILNLILHPRNLEWVVQDEVLKVTTQDAASQLFETHVYSVAHLIEAEHEPEDLIETITACIAPDSWVDSGGGGVAKIAPGAVVVRQTQRVHGEIERLLLELEDATLEMETPAEKPAAVARRNLPPRPVRASFLKPAHRDVPRAD